MAANVDVCVFGSLNIDYFCYVEEQPQIGQTIHAHGFQKAYGGKGANQCVMAARLGAKTAMVGKVGQDDEGEVYKRYLTNEGVDATQVGGSTSCATGMAFIWVDDAGRNQIVISAAANGDYKVAEVAGADNIRKAKVFVTQLEVDLSSTLAALQEAHKAGVKTLFNPSPARTDLGNEWFQATDVLVVNEVEASILSGGMPVETREQQAAAAEALMSLGCKEVVMTLGAEGVLYYRHIDGKLVLDSIEGCKVAKVVDTTGAGDCFLGALSAYVSRGVDMPTALSKANQVAAMSVQKKQCQPSYPFATELPEHLKLPA